MSWARSTEESGWRHDASWWPVSWRNALRLSCRSVMEVSCSDQREVWRWA
jgi:hypothetical protein